LVQHSYTFRCAAAKSFISAASPPGGGMYFTLPRSVCAPVCFDSYPHPVWSSAHHGCAKPRWRHSEKMRTSDGKKRNEKEMFKRHQKLAEFFCFSFASFSASARLSFYSTCPFRVFCFHFVLSRTSASRIARLFFWLGCRSKFFSPEPRFPLFLTSTTPSPAFYPRFSLILLPAIYLEGILLLLCPINPIAVLLRRGIIITSTIPHYPASSLISS
jgi:hypothetical protein